MSKKISINFREEFAQIIEDIRVNQETTKEEIKKATQPMLDFIGKYFTSRNSDLSLVTPTQILRCGNEKIT